jgi:hypothetical protein
MENKVDKHGLVCPLCGYGVRKYYYGIFHDEFYWFCPNEQCENYDEKIHDNMLMKLEDWIERQR